MLAEVGALPPCIGIYALAQVHIMILDSPRLDERANALDAWLADLLATDWALAKASWGLHADRGEIVAAQAWRFFLPAMFAVRHMGREGASVEEATRVREALRRKPDLAMAGEFLALVNPHEVVSDDLAGVWHPKLGGVGVEVVRADDRGVSLGSIGAALGLLKQGSSRSYALVTTHCGAICFIRPTQQTVAGLCVSTTSKSIPGLVYLSPVPTILSAESLVHEAAHLALGLHEIACRLYVDPHRKVQTPLRSDPRPISGLLHQIWVLAYLRDLYCDLLIDSSEVVRVNLAKIDARLGRHERDLSEGIHVARQWRSAFTEAGWHVVESIARRAEAVRIGN